MAGVQLILRVVAAIALAGLVVALLFVGGRRVGGRAPLAAPATGES